MSQKLTLNQAILININVMLSTGIFLNSIPLVKLAGTYSPLIYIFVAICILPLILGISKLLKIFPGGSFYNYANESLGEKWGFLSSWSYFTGKLASATIMTHFGLQIIQSLFPFLQHINIFVIDIIVLNLFTWANLQNLKTGSQIQQAFLVFKSIPVLFIILSGLYIFTGSGLHLGQFSGWNVLTSIPLVIYAFTGFEAACSLSRHIKDSEKNAPIAILTSFSIVVIFSVLYQFVFSQLIDKTCLINSDINYVKSIPLILGYLNLSNTLISKIIALFQLFIATSALGGAYGVIFSNSWNLFALSENNHIIFKKLFTKFNKHNIPLFCVITELLICLTYLTISGGSNIFLQQFSAIGCTLAYLITIVSYIFIKPKAILGYLGTATSLVLISIAITSALKTMPIAILTFLIILTFGMASYFFTKKTKI